MNIIMIYFYQDTNQELHFETNDAGTNPSEHHKYR